MRSNVVASFLGLLALGCASGASNTGTHSASQVAAAYYEGLAGKRHFETVPMAKRLAFSGPGRTASDAVSFRKLLVGLAPRVQGFDLRYQMAGDDFVLSFYDLDLGVAGGPIPMAERLRVVDGEIVEVELLFDPRRLPRPPSTEGGRDRD